MSKKTKVYFCILGLLVFLFVFLAVFSNEPHGNCSICGKQETIGEGLHWDVLFRKWYYFQQKRDNDMMVSVLLCDDCQQKEKKKRQNK